MPLAEINAVKQAYIKLPVGGTTRIDAPCLTLDLEGVALAQLLATRFLIARNGSVSDRLWRLVIARTRMAMGRRTTRSMPNWLVG